MMPLEIAFCVRIITILVYKTSSVGSTCFNHPWYTCLLHILSNILKIETYHNALSSLPNAV